MKLLCVTILFLISSVFSQPSPCKNEITIKEYDSCTVISNLCLGIKIKSYDSNHFSTYLSKLEDWKTKDTCKIEKRLLKIICPEKSILIRKSISDLTYYRLFDSISYSLQYSYVVDNSKRIKIQDTAELQFLFSCNPPDEALEELYLKQNENGKYVFVGRHGMETDADSITGKNWTGYWGIIFYGKSDGNGYTGLGSNDLFIAWKKLSNECYLYVKSEEVNNRKVLFAINIMNQLQEIKMH
jgi:hypothetical protein